MVTRGRQRPPKVTRGRQRSLCQEIADLLAELGHLEGLPVENQEIADNQEFADFLAGL